MKYIIIVFFTLSIFNVGAQDLNSGSIFYSVKFKTENIDKIKQRFADNSSKASDNYLMQMYKNHYQIYNSRQHFTLVKFNHENYISLPIDVMLPDQFSGKFVLKQTDIYYRDLSKNVIVQNFKRYNKRYSVENPINYTWEILSETKIIAGYKCRKAKLVSQESSKIPTIIAWFTTQIPISLSPSKYGGLPGAILSYEDGLRIRYATKIKLKEVTIEKPEGKLISYDDYKAMFGKPGF